MSPVTIIDKYYPEDNERQVIVGEVVALGLGHVVGLVQLENLVVSVRNMSPSSLVCTLS